MSPERDPKSVSELSASARERGADCKDAARSLLDDPESSLFARAVHYAVVLMIGLSTLLAILQTVEEISRAYSRQLDFLEMAFTAFFTLEILTRLWTTEGCCLRYCMSLANIVDILATLPWYLEQALDLSAGADGSAKMQGMANSMRTLRMVRLVRTVRLLRVLRLAKAARHSETLSTVFESIWDSLEGIFVLVFLVGMGSVVTASLVYIVEFDEESGNFASIPSSMWWSMATMTTVGYGDVVPSTPMGKAIACFAMLLGLIVNSVAVATITTSFTESYNRRTAMTKAAKSLRKARTLLDRGELADASAPMLSEAGAQSQPLPGSHQERLHLDLASMFVLLEEDTKVALTRLELSLEESTMHANGSSEPDGSQVIPRVSVSRRNITKHDTGAVALQALHDQSHAFFKSVMHLVEMVAENELELERAAAGLRYKRQSNLMTHAATAR